MSKLIIRTYEKDLPMGEIGKEDFKKLENMSSYLAALGSPLYHLGDGRVTGKEGWELFNQNK